MDHQWLYRVSVKAIHVCAYIIIILDKALYTDADCHVSRLLLVQSLTIMYRQWIGHLHPCLGGPTCTWSPGPVGRLQWEIKRLGDTVPARLYLIDIPVRIKCLYMYMYILCTVDTSTCTYMYMYNTCSLIHVSTMLNTVPSYITNNSVLRMGLNTTWSIPWTDKSFAHSFNLLLNF